MKRRASALVGVLILLILSGCKGKPLPKGMEEADLLKAGQEVFLMLVEEDYEAVYASFREDVAETMTADDLKALTERQLKDVGEYRQITDRMVTGQSSNGEEYGVAVLYCQYSKDHVLFRAAFDTDIALIGIEIKKQ